MSTAVQAHSPAEQSRCVALVGHPNCGKTALFNLLTGTRQKVANYAGVTVERKLGQSQLPDGRGFTVVDLPGAYSLRAATPDEEVTRDVILGLRDEEAAPDTLVAVVDATHLRANLRLVLELKRLGRPLILALNMADVAQARGLRIDRTILERELGCAVVETVAVRREGHAQLLAALGQAWHDAAARSTPAPARQHAQAPAAPSAIDALPSTLELQHEVRRILALAVTETTPGGDRVGVRVDHWLLHPVWGLAFLAVLLFVVFQAVFAWAAWPMGIIKDGMAALGELTLAHMSEGPLRSLIVDGVIAGVGGVLVFLPQILILFFFILVLEDSGYLPRAAFLLDNAMGKVGLSGRAFIPLLSSFACAVPGIMATRTIGTPRERLATIMIAPLMTCSARLPVYALLIGAFVPAASAGPFNLQGLTLFGLYVAGVLSACVVAWLFKRTWLRSGYQPLMLELPPYRWPNLRNLLLGLWERARIFVRRVGTIIFALMVLLWFMSTWPAPPEGATGAAVRYSLAGQLGLALQPLFAPIGFGWEIVVALVPGMAAREAAVGALGTVYALSASGDAVAESLAPVIAQGWSQATAYSLLAWFVFAPQCISTLVTVRRETGGWRYPALMAGYLFALAYAAAFVTYRVALALGG